MSREEINVLIGEVRVARRGEILKAILGSCVGIGFLWRERKICGLAHCLLAKSPQTTFTIGGRFVDQAIPSLLALLKVKPDHFSEIEVIVAGGGNMTNPDAQNRSELVGSQNLVVAESILKALGIRPARVDRADQEGRKITIDSTDCSYVIEPIPRLNHTLEAKPDGK